VPIYRLLENTSFDPEAIHVMAHAFEGACKSLGLADRPRDPLREIVAKKVIELAQAGVRDPVQLYQLTVQAFQR